MRIETFTLLALIALKIAVAHPEDGNFPIEVRIQPDRSPARTFHLSIGVGESESIVIDSDLTLNTKATDSRGRQFIEVSLHKGVIGRSHALATSIRPAGARSYSFTVCGERAVLEEPIPGSSARCDNLPAFRSPDKCFGQCFDYPGAYEGIPATLTTRARIAPPSAVGDPLLLSGRVLDQLGKPRPGVTIYAYQHADGEKVLPLPNPPRSFYSQEHGVLRAWVSTDLEGRYTFDTVRPVAAPESDEPAHIHLFTIEPGCAIAYVDPVFFAGDPRITAENSPRLLKGWGGSGLTHPRRSPTGVWLVERDIVLGQNIPGYPGCSRRR